MARKNKPGRPADLEKKIRVAFMRDVENMSFTEIGNVLGIKKQTARKHYLDSEKVIHKTPIDI